MKILPGIGVKTALKLADSIAEAGGPDDPATLVPAKRKYATDFARLIDMIQILKNESSPISEKVERINHESSPVAELHACSPSMPFGGCSSS